LPIYSDHGASRWLIKIGLSLYDLLAWKKQHQYFSREDFIQVVPNIRQTNLVGGFRFVDAQVDDARLVLRVIDKASKKGIIHSNTASRKISRLNKLVNSIA
jgi:Glycerol-3-phosphate dehydrogenase